MRGGGEGGRGRNNRASGLSVARVGHRTLGEREQQQRGERESGRRIHTHIERERKSGLEGGKEEGETKKGTHNTHTHTSECEWESRLATVLTVKL